MRIIEAAWRACVALSVVLSAVSSARGDMIVTEGVKPWHLCATCHNLDGISPMPRFPKLAGQRPLYIIKQVRDFGEGRRSNDGGQMQTIASEIGDEDLAKTASYFASLPPPPPAASLATDGAEWRRGATLYFEGDPGSKIPHCASCHENAAPGLPQGPFLSAQHAAYLTKQLRDWRAGARANSDEMPAIAAKLSDQDIEALALFLATKPRAAVTDGQ
jgi:cytochrome c553